ncbi:MAG: hypothetical protein Q9M97_06600 [Candidatus Gracilibacteria bacterium]|nr:hypothetical protein [Candidatus Gracilibacteria bacterium]
MSDIQEPNREINKIVDNLKEDNISADDFENKISAFDEISDITNFDNEEGYSEAELKIKTLLEKKGDIEQQKIILEKIVEGLRNNEDLKIVKDAKKEIEFATSEVNESTQILSELKTESEELNQNYEKNTVKIYEVSTKLDDSKKIIDEKTILVKKIEIKVKNGTASKEEARQLIQLQKQLESEKEKVKTNESQNLKYLERDGDLKNQKDFIVTEIEDTKYVLDTAIQKVITGSQKIKEVNEFSDSKCVKNECKVTSDLSSAVLGVANIGLKSFKSVNENIESSDTLTNLSKAEIEANKVKVVNNKEQIKKTEESLKEIESFLKQMNENKNDLGAISVFYNSRDIKFYQENPEDIINITDKEKLKEVLNNIKCNPGKKEFIDFINDNFLDDLDILKLFIKKSTIKLDTKNIKNFDKESIKGRELEFFKLLKPATLRNFLISNYYGKKIKDFSKEAEKNGNAFLYEESFGEPSNRTFSEYLESIGSTESNDKALLKDFNIDKITFEENSDKLDNTLSNLLDDNPEKVLSLFMGENNIDKLYTLPKLLYKIKNKVDATTDEKFVISMMNIEPLFYDKFLSQTMQKEYSILYIDSLLTKNKDTKNKGEHLSKNSKSKT